MRIGVISDTHGFLSPDAIARLEGVDRIFHGGDIGSLPVLYSLEGIAPTDAVFGNMDNPIIQSETREKIVTCIDGITIGIAHGGGSPFDIIERLENMFRDDNVDIIVFGHTHKPHHQKLGDVLFFNPGDGRKSVGFIEIENGKYTAVTENLK